MHKLFTRFIALSLLCGAVLVGWSVPPRAELPLLPGIQEILDKGKLVVAVLNEERPPVFFTDKDGKLTGLDVDLAKAIARRLKVQLEFDRSAESYDEVIALVATGKADLGISYLSRTPARARSVLFTRPYVTEYFTLLINRRATLQFGQVCPSLAQLLRESELAGQVGVRSGSAIVARLREVEPDAQPREFQSNDDLIEAVRVGEVAISIQSELSAGRYLHENPAARIHLRYCRIPGRPDDVAIAVRPGQYDLLNWLNVYLADYEIHFDAAELVGHKGKWAF